MPDSVHTRKLSRRTALRGGAAVAVAAAVPSVAVADDRKLLSEIAEFRKLWAEYVEVDTAAHAGWAKADAAWNAAHPGAPKSDDIAVWRAMMDQHCDGAWDRANEADTKIRRVSADLFALPALTLEGVLAKVALAHDILDYLELGDAETWDFRGGDSAAPWTLQIQRDLERLAGGAA